MAPRRLTLRLLAASLAPLAGTTLLSAAPLQLKVSPAPVPTEVSADVRAVLQTNVVQLLDSAQPRLELWLRAELPLASAPASDAKSLDALKQPVLLGVARISADTRDYRDDELPAGVYTVRYGLQPADGNHLGSSDFTYFAVLIRAAKDLKPDAIADYKALTKASSEGTSTDHPLILSLRPVSGAVGPVPSLQEPAPDHQCVRLQLDGRAGTTKAAVVFDLVYAGKAPK